MKCLLVLGIFALLAISSCKASDFMIGNSLNSRLAWQQKAEYSAFPFMKRVKELFYSDPGQQIIKAVIARDINHSAASVTITAGGIGSSFVNLRFKSERGSGLHYLVEIYV